MGTNCILERVAETRSTNDDLLARWRAGALIDPVARMAHRQTAGKGRAGRTWIATPEDSLCFSLAYPFQRNIAQLSGLSLLIGLAVIEGIAAACATTPNLLLQQGLRLKWPNDILLNGAKLGGILIEGGQTKVGDPTWMVIGVGMNLQGSAQIQSNLGAQSSQKVSALNELHLAGSAPPEKDYLWLQIVESIEKQLFAFERTGFKPYQTQWMQWDAYKDQLVCISGAGKEVIYGIAKGVDQSGALLLEHEGKLMTIHAGDVSLRVQS